MEELELVALFWQRNEDAIGLTEESFGSYLKKIAVNILNDQEEARECLNDTLLAAWNGIPPARPEHLRLWLGRVTRQLAIDRWRRSKAEKRQAGEYALCLEELAEIVSGTESPEDEAVTAELRQSIECFLRSQPEKNRHAFILRYYHAEPLERIADRLGLTVSAVKSSLWRTRNGLKRTLLKEGYTL